jgi:hypothetical protein
MHEVRSPHYRLADDDDLSDDGRAMHDPAFHDRLNHAVHDGSLHDGLYDLSLDDATLYDRSNDVTLYDAALHARRIVIILDLQAAPSETMVEHIIVFNCIGSTVLRSGGRGCDDGGSRIGERGQATYGE